MRYPFFRRTKRAQFLLASGRGAGDAQKSENQEELAATAQRWCRDRPLRASANIQHRRLSFANGNDDYVTKAWPR
jgi:hypothetical protein